MKKLPAIVLLLSTMLFGQAVVADITEVDNAALHELLEQGVAVIDVRRPDEWQSTGVVAGTHLLTFFDKQGRYDAKAWLKALEEIAPKGTPVVLMCARGVRSKSIANLLDKQLGFVGVHNHTSGIVDWIKDGEPVIRVDAQNRPINE